MNNQEQSKETNDINAELVNRFVASVEEKKIALDILNEWSKSASIHNLCIEWEKNRPANESENLLILLYNCECLSTHVNDIDILLSKFLPHIVILTGVGSQIRKMPSVPHYYWYTSKGSNSFGGVAMLIHSSIKSKVIHAVENLLIVEVNMATIAILVGAVYVPPKSNPPLDEFEKFLNKKIYIFGDFNAKNTQWHCKSNNSSGILLSEWMERNGWIDISPNKATSKRSDAIIDFAIAQDRIGWNCEVTNEGTADHYPVVFAAPFTISEKSFFRKTNWKILNFILSCLFTYWNQEVYNLDEQIFFSLFSTFLAALCDRTSVYLPVTKYKPPWPRFLIKLAKDVNTKRKRYRRTRFLCHFEEYIGTKKKYQEARANFEQERREKRIQYISKGLNVWHFARPYFHSYTPAFQGLTIEGKIERDPQKICDRLGNFFEQHFSPQQPKELNEIHKKYFIQYEEIAKLTNMPLEQISYTQVYMNWKKFSPKKSLDSMKTSAYLLKNIPIEYINIFTVLFNKCAAKGEMFKDGKHAKVVCLSKEGLYPDENRLRPISLLPNIGKWYERCIHDQIMKWCSENNIFVDEQSGFTAHRRLQTRILTLCEDLRLTTAACNRPALVVFIDFLSAFDRLYYPALISNLLELDMPLHLIRWIYLWLQDRTMRIHHGEAKSKIIKIFSGAPQGSVLSATLFRLHIHFLPKLFAQFSTHMFADDVALVIKGSIEKRLSLNIKEIEIKANIAMKILEKFSNDVVLPVNVKKTKVMLVHNAISPAHPKVIFNNEIVESVAMFKYLGVEIRTKMGWGNFITTRMKKIRNIYSALRIMYKKIPIENYKIRKKLFCAFALPHFIWLFVAWFYYTENQKQKVEHLYCTGIRIVYNLNGWNDYTTLTLARDKSLLDYVYHYWMKFMKHLNESPEGREYRETWEAYLIIKTAEKSLFKSLSLRKNNFFMNRLIQKAQHTNLEVFSFFCIQEKQKEYFKKTDMDVKNFMLKYIGT